MRTKAKIQLFLLDKKESDIAKELGVSQAYVNRCLAGKQKPSQRLVEAVARATNLPATEEIFR